MDAADLLQRVSEYFGIKLEELAKKRTPIGIVERLRWR